jgi:hypothetical protein
MYTRAVVGADTVQKGCAYVKDGIKKKHTIPRIEVSNFIQKRKATPTSQGTVTVDGKVLEPRDLMLYFEFNPRDYEAHWYAEQLQPTLLDRELPQTAEAFMMMQAMLRLNEFFELHTWRGRIDYDPDGANVDPTTKGAEAGDVIYLYFDGLIKKLLDDATTILVSTPATLVAGTAGGGEENIGAAFLRSYKLVPKALLYRYGVKGLKFMVGYPTQQVYEEFLTTTTTFKNNDTTEKSINRYKGYEVVPLAGIPDNTIVVCIANPDITSNVWIGLNSVQDENALKLAQLQANSELYFVKGLFKMDTQTGFPDQIVLYTSQIA